ncbi:MAG: Gfo/Idh/MocA family oxidoreductase [Caldilineaceae bacterium]|nr:Gfo/Idh/MocA family oxidoreductase [Caldilineaceae bacterium]
MSSMHGIPFERCEVARVGFIGVGGRGRSLLREMLACEGVQVTTVADSSPEATAQAAALIVEAGQAAPTIFTGADSWQRLLEADLDLVLVATPWATHTPHALAAMEAGKHVAVEVPVATTVAECWQLVETSERTRRHCIMLENCCYDYWETLVKRMAQAGLLGEITHAECSYVHDLRKMLLEDFSEGLWRRRAHIERDGNLYPTHGLGPVAKILGIGADDSFDYLISMSSKERGLSAYRDATLPVGDPKRNEIYRCGDMNSSLIRTKQGRTILLQHDSHTPRPYERNFLIGGTKGLFRDYPPRLYLDGLGKHEAWLPIEEYKTQWEDPLWTNLGELARKRGGHGGMDFIMIYRLLQTIHEGLPPDMDVYEAVEWSVPGPLSEQSVADRSRPVDFPDFRRSAKG